MRQHQIAVIVGSLREDSINRKLAQAITMLAPSRFHFKQVEISDLPRYNQDDFAEHVSAVRRFKGEIHAATGLIFVTPEYNHRLPGVLKDAIDHASHPCEQSVLTHKPAGILGASVGGIGTAVAQRELRTALACADVPTMVRPTVLVQVKEDGFDEAGNITSAGTRKLLMAWMERYIAWVTLHAA